MIIRKSTCYSNKRNSGKFLKEAIGKSAISFVFQRKKLRHFIWQFQSPLGHNLLNTLAQTVQLAIWTVSSARYLTRCPCLPAAKKTLPLRWKIWNHSRKWDTNVHIWLPPCFLGGFFQFFFINCFYLWSVCIPHMPKCLLFCTL